MPVVELLDEGLSQCGASVLRQSEPAFLVLAQLLLIGSWLLSRIIFRLVRHILKLGGEALAGGEEQGQGDTRIDDA